MKLAIPDYNGYISPLLDEAKSITLVDVQDDGSLRWSMCASDCPLEELLEEKGISYVLCGALSRELWNRVTRKGIIVVHRLSGQVDDIVEAFCNNNISSARYRMPGCLKVRKMSGCCPFFEDPVAERKEKKEKPMKIAVTAQGRSLEDSVDPRFGRAQGFMIFDEESKTWTFVENAQNYSSVQGAGIQSAGTIVDAGVSVVLTGNLGPKAYRVLNEAEVASYLVKDCTVEEALKMYYDGSLDMLKNANVEGHW